MSDDPIMAALARLEAGQERLTTSLTWLETSHEQPASSQAHLIRVVDRHETKVDRLTDDMQAVKLRLSAVEVDLGSIATSMATQSVAAGANTSRIDGWKRVLR